MKTYTTLILLLSLALQPMSAGQSKKNSDGAAGQATGASPAPDATLEKKLRRSNPLKPYDNGSWNRGGNNLYFLQNRSVILSFSEGADCKTIEAKEICLPNIATYPLTLVESSSKTLTYTMGKNIATEAKDPAAAFFEGKKLQVEFISNKKIIVRLDVLEIGLTYLTAAEHNKIQ